MKRLLAALILLAPLPARAQTAAPAVTRFTAAGITVIHKPITANDVVAARLYLKGGSAALTPGTAGIERLIVETMTHGTEKYSKDQFSALATTTGTEFGSQVEYDFTSLNVQALRQHWGEAWDLFTQAALHPTFPADELEQVQGQVADALKQRRDVPDNHLTVVADSALYAGHAYAADPQGTAEGIARLTRDDLVNWHRRRFTKANLLLVVVGNVSRQDLTAKVTAAFGRLPATGGEAAAPAPLAGVTPDLVTVQQQLPTNYIMGVFAAPAPSHPDFPAFRAATRVLSEKMFEEVRTKRNLSYAVRAAVRDRAANQGFVYVTAVQPDTTIKVMLNEVRDLQREPVPADRLGQSTNVYLTQYLMSQQTNMGQAAELGLWELVGGGWENGQRFPDRLRAVTPAEIQRAAQTYLKGARFVVIGDPSKIDRRLFTSL